MKKLMQILSVLVISLVFAGAAIAQSEKPATDQPVVQQPATDQPAVQAPAPSMETKATIYFYRTKQFAGSGLEPSVFGDEKELARMDNGRYFGVTLEPGKHTFRMGDKQTGFEIDMKAGQAYYARITIDVGFWKGHGRLTLMQPEQGAFEIKKVQALGASKVRNRDMVTIFEGSEKTAPAEAKN